VNAWIEKQRRSVLAWVLALLPAIVLAPWFEHQDLMLNSFVSNVIAYGHLNVYSYFSSHPSLASIATVMPPLYYLTNGCYLFLLRLVGLDPISRNPGLIYMLRGDPHGVPAMLDLFLLKMLNLVALAVGLYWLDGMRRVLGTDRWRSWVTWCIAVIPLSAGVVQAQVDIIPAVLTLGGLYYMAERRPSLSMLCLGLGAAYKNYPLLLVPIGAAFLSCGSFRVWMRLTALALGVYIATLVPFLSRTLVVRVFLAHDSTTLFGHFVTVGMLPLDPWMLLYVLTCFAAWQWARSLPQGDRLQFFQVVGAATCWLTVVSGLYLFSFWLPQWLAWAMPSIAVLAGMDITVFYAAASANVAFVVYDLVYKSNHCRFSRALAMLVVLC
jgi:hypothetical protein